METQETKSLQMLECYRGCGPKKNNYRWFPRSFNLPKVCPNCGSTHWMDPPKQKPARKPQ